MNDIILKGNTVKRELVIFLISIVFAFGVNIYAIIAYKTEWSELFTSLGFVAIIALVFYVVVGIVRILINISKIILGAGK